MISRHLPVYFFVLALAMLTWASQATAAPPVGDEMPPGIEAHRLLPLQGADRDKARLSAEKIAAALPKPPFMEEGLVDATRKDIEPPLEAQRAYAQARDAYHQGKGFEAIRKLMIAERRAPDSPGILKLLGRIYTETGNKVRGVSYLTRAAALEPADMDSVFLIGRFELEQNRWETAAATFYHAVRLQKDPATATDDPALLPLLHYYLAAALQRAGYAEQAVAQFNAYLNYDRRFERYTPRTAELAFVDHGMAGTWETVGDLLNQLARPKDALEAYRRAAEVSKDRGVGLVKRQVFTLLQLKDTKAAETMVLDYIRASNADPASLELANYFFNRAGSDALSQELERLYDEGDRSGNMAITLANLLPPERGMALLKRHMASAPADGDAYAQLLRIVLQGEGSAKVRRDTLVRAITLTSDSMAGSPSHASVYVQALLDTVKGPREVVDAIAAMPEEQAARPQTLAIKGVSLRMLRQNLQASEALALSLERDPDSTFARIEQARVFIAQQRFDEAAKLLAGDWPGDDVQVLLLRARVLSEAGRPDAALTLLDEAIAKQNDGVDLVLQKAEVLMAAQRTDDAKRVLNDALNATPNEEKLYAALLEFYRKQLSLGMREEAAPMQELMARMLSTIPGSRTARLLVAELRMDAREYDRSEQLLKALLEEDSHDLTALGLLIRLYEASNRRDAANDLRERFFRSLPEGSDRALALAAFYRFTERPGRAIEELQDALSRPLLDRPEAVVAQLWRYMLEMNPGDLDTPRKMIVEAAERFPGHASDINYELASLLSQQGKDKESQEVLSRILKAEPNHAASANGLGYAWAVAGVNLDKAQELIQRALDQQPDNAAFLDSMGWVLYRKGDIEGAIEWLLRATDAEYGSHPVLYDHLGDALYRRGRKAEAVRRWESARSLLNLSQYDDPETRDLPQRLDAKIEAVKQGAEPAITDIVGDAKPPKP